jgi:hypothetical protein
MTVTALPTNRGLAASIIAEVSTLCASHGRVIVVEDDLLVEPATLAWLNAGLNAYADDDRVMQISAYQYRVPEFEDRQSGVFQHIAMTWGWATWHRAWSRFDPDANGWREVENRGRTRSDFNAGDAYPFSQMLIKQMTGRLDSWGIRWSWSVFRAGGVTLMPPRSLVTNEGFQEGATHNSVGWAKRFVSGAQPRLWRDEEPPCMPDDVHVSPADESAFRRGLLRTRARRNARVKAVLAWFGFRQFR